MLRLGTVDGGEAGGTATFAPALLGRALEHVAVDREEAGPGAVAIEHLCAALISDTPRQGLAQVERLMACGVSVETIYETFIPRTAARLGELWVEDLLSFTGVTVAMARLTDIFRSLSPLYLKHRAPVRRHRRALLTLAPGEQHALGVVLAGDEFQRAGWSVQVELQADAEALARLVGEQKFEAVGLSAGSRRGLPAVERLVGRLRRVARGAPTFLLGGPVVALEAGLAASTGVDLATGSAAAAIGELERGR